MRKRVRLKKRERIWMRIWKTMRERATMRLELPQPKLSRHFNPGKSTRSLFETNKQKHNADTSMNKSPDQYSHHAASASHRRNPRTL